MQTLNRSLLLACCLLVPAIAAQAATIRIPSDQPTLAAAFAVARTGDTLILAPGVHREAGLTVPVGLRLRGSGHTPAETVIDAQGAGRILLIESLADSTIVSNLTFRNSAAVGKNSYDKSGGAVFINRSKVRLENCVFVDNAADAHGGAIRVAGAWPMIFRCTFRGNRALNGGGGAIEASFDASPVIKDCVFEDNSARWGGAVSVRVGGSVLIVSSVLANNHASGDLGYGGAIFADKNSIVDVMNVVISGNRGRFGGGVTCLANSMVNLDQVTITDNVGTVIGGGMLLVDASPAISGAIFAFNQGTGISLAGASKPTITCTNVFGNSGGDWLHSVASAGDMEFNFYIDPLFCSRDPLAADGLHLQHNSYLFDPPYDCSTLGAQSIACGASTTEEVPPVGVGIANAAASPNPFNPQTNIGFTLGQDQTVRVAVFGLRGELVRTLADGRLTAGEHEFSWQGRDQAGRVVGSGVYFVVIHGQYETQSLKLTLLK